MTNQVDVAQMGYVNIGLMEEKNFHDYRVIAGVFTGGQNLTLAKDVKATTWKDLEGHKLGSPPNSYSELIFKASARLAKAAVHDPEDIDALWEQWQRVHRALRRMETVLDRAE